MDLVSFDVKTREIVGVYLVEQEKLGAKGLWNSFPEIYRQCAVCSTDFWEACTKVFPQKRH